MHENIKAFHTRGVMDPMANLVSTKERLVLDLEATMRELGYVPVLDLEPQLTREFIEKDESHSFKLTVYGVLVKGKNPWEWAGISNGKLMKSTVKSK